MDAICVPCPIPAVPEVTEVQPVCVPCPVPDVNLAKYGIKSSRTESEIFNVYSNYLLGFIQAKSPNRQLRFR